MARAYAMSWEQSKNRWVKMYRGQRYTVAASVLGGKGQLDTYVAANEWWRAKKHEIDGVPQKIQPGTPEALQAVLAAWAGQPVETAEQEHAVILDLMANYHQVEDKQGLQHAILGPERVAQLQAQAKAMLDAPVAPAGRSVAANAEGWHKAQRGKVAVDNSA